MILTRNGESLTVEGKTFVVGATVWTNSASEYRGLIGRITEIRSGDDMETDNDCPDIYCSFEIPEKKAVVQELESRFSALYRTEKHIDELGLDSVIMAPDMLEPVAPPLPAEHGTLYVLAYDYTGGTDPSAGILAVSSDPCVLMRKMLDDMAADDFPLFLLDTERTVDSTSFVFEDAEDETIHLTYLFAKVPFYIGAEGGSGARSA